MVRSRRQHDSSLFPKLVSNQGLLPSAALIPAGTKIAADLACANRSVSHLAAKRMLSSHNQSPKSRSTTVAGQNTVNPLFFRKLLAITVFGFDNLSTIRNLHTMPRFHSGVIARLNLAGERQPC